MPDCPIDCSSFIGTALPPGVRQGSEGMSGRILKKNPGIPKKNWSVDLTDKAYFSPFRVHTASISFLIRSRALLPKRIYDLTAQAKNRSIRRHLISNQEGVCSYHRPRSIMPSFPFVALTKGVIALLRSSKADVSIRSRPAPRLPTPSLRLTTAIPSNWPLALTPSRALLSTKSYGFKDRV